VPPPARPPAPTVPRRPCPPQALAQGREIDPTPDPESGARPARLPTLLRAKDQDTTTPAVALAVFAAIVLAALVAFVSRQLGG